MIDLPNWPVTVISFRHLISVSCSFSVSTDIVQCRHMTVLCLCLLCGQIVKSE